MGTKKSDFIAETSVSSDSYMDFWANGQNYRVSYANFLAGINIVGGLPVPNIYETSLPYTAVVDDDYVVGSGPIELTFPMLNSAVKPVIFINDGSQDITLNGNGSAVPDTGILSPSQVRGFLPLALKWIEI
jgi:hypothetical protein